MNKHHVHKPWWFWLLAIFCSLSYGKAPMAPSDGEQAAIHARFAPVSYDGTRAASSLPPKVLNLKYLPVIGDQFIGVCGAFAPVYYLKTYVDAQQQKLAARPNPEIDPEHVASPAWGELAFLHGFSGETSTGASLVNIISQMTIHGMLSWQDLPYSHDFAHADHTMPTVEQQKKALFNKSACGEYIGGLNSPTGLLNLKRYLQDGHIAVVTLRDTSKNFHSLEVGTSNGVFYRAQPSKDGPSSHALTVVGYDDAIAYVDDRDGTTKHGAFLLANSWGQNWGISPQEGVERGFIWIAYDFFLAGGMLPDAYGLVNRARPHVPTLTATIRLHNLSETWNIPYYAVIPLYHQLKFLVNDQPTTLRIPCAGDHNLTSGRPDGDLEIVLDLTGYAHHTYPKLSLVCNTTSETPLFEVVSVQLEKDGHSLTVPGPTPLGTISKATPSVQLTPLAFTQAGLTDFHPRSGTAVQGDFDGDGIQDLAVVTQTAATAGTDTYDGQQLLVLLRGKGDGTFMPPQKLPAESIGLLSRDLYATQLVTADFDLDGDLDLVTPGTDAKLHLFRNDGKGNFTLEPQPLPVKAGAGLAAADFNRDGRVDLAVTNETGLQLLANTRNGWKVFTLVKNTYDDYDNPARIGCEQAVLAWGDFNGDHLPDLAVHFKNNDEGPVFKIFFNQGQDGNTWRFQPDTQPPRTIAAYRPGNVPLVADLNNDGRDEVIFSSWQGRVHLYQLDPENPGQLTELVQTEQPQSLLGGAAVAADFDGDGQREIALSGRTEYEHMPYGKYAPPAEDHAPHHVFLYQCNEQNMVRRLPLAMPGASGQFMQVGMMTVGNFNGDNAPDLFLGGCCGGASEGTQQNWGPLSDSVRAFVLQNQFPHNWFGTINRNQPPKTPTNLHAENLGRGRVRFTWSCTDDTTPEAGLRFALRIGSTAGGTELHSGRITSAATALAVKSGIVLTLPQGPLHWSVQAMDAGLATSPWAAEQRASVTSQPTPVSGLALLSPDSPEVTVTIGNKASLPEGCTAEVIPPQDLYGNPLPITAGSEVTLDARSFLAEDWVFSHWSGPVREPLRSHTSLVPGPHGAVVSAHFIHVSRSQPRAFHCSSVLHDCFVWGYDHPKYRGPAWHVGPDGLPDFAAMPPDARFINLNHKGIFYMDWQKCRYLDGEAIDNLPRFIGSRENYRITFYQSLPNREISLISAPRSDRYYEPECLSFNLDDRHDLLTLSPPEPSFACVQLGERTILALGNDARLYAQGANENGEFGNGTCIGSPAFKHVATEQRFCALALGKGPSPLAAAIDLQGNLWQWGDGQPRPQKVALPRNAKCIAVRAGDGFILALAQDNQLYAWGNNCRGQLGDGTRTNCDTPRLVSGLPKIIGLAAGYAHTVAVADNGDVYAWGANEYGQVTGLPGEDILLPQKLELGKGTAELTLTDSNAAAVGAGTTSPPPGTHLALSGSPLTLKAKDGERYLFDHWEGTGIANPKDPQTTVTLNGNATVRACWKLKPGLKATLRLHAITQDGTTPWTWPDGPLTVTTRPQQRPPGTVTPAVDTTHEFAAGDHITLTAVPAPQYVFTGWVNRNTGDVLSTQPSYDLTVTSDLDLNATFKLRPFKTAVDGCWAEEYQHYSGYMLEEDGTVYVTYEDNYKELSLKSFGGARIVKVITTAWSPSNSPSFIALGNDGHVYTWGNDADYFGRTSEYHYDRIPALVRAPGDDTTCLNGAQLIAANRRGVIARCADGGLYGWGRLYGNLDYQSEPLRRPRLITPPPDFNPSLIRDMKGMGEASFLFLLADGTVWSWGDEIPGTGQNHPVITPIPALKNIVQIQTAATMAMALKDDGTVWIWGQDQNLGQLGFGQQTVTLDTPRQIPGLKDIARIFCDGYACEAQTQDGVIYQWGELSYRREHNGNWITQTYVTPTVITTPSHFMLPPEIPHRTLTLKTTPRTERLLSQQIGTWTYLDGDTVTLAARSNETFTFQQWLVNGVPRPEPTLTLTMTQSHAVAAQFQAAAQPQLTLGDGAGTVGKTISLPLTLTEGSGSYCALDCTLELPPGITLEGIESAPFPQESEPDQYAEPEFSPIPPPTDSFAQHPVRPTADIAHWPVTRSGETESRIRLIITDLDHPFAPDSKPIVRLRFRLSQDIVPGETHITLKDASCLGYNQGRHAEQAKGNQARLNIAPDSTETFVEAGDSLYLDFTPKPDAQGVIPTVTMVTEIPPDTGTLERIPDTDVWKFTPNRNFAGIFAFTASISDGTTETRDITVIRHATLKLREGWCAMGLPGPLAEGMTLQELMDTATVQLSRFWAWRNGRWTLLAGADDIRPHEAVLAFSQTSAVISCQLGKSSHLTLRPGWNLVCIAPHDMAQPRIVFRLDANMRYLRQGTTSLPAGCFWIYCPTGKEGKL